MLVSLRAIHNASLLPKIFLVSKDRRPLITVDHCFQATHKCQNTDGSLSLLRSNKHPINNRPKCDYPQLKT